jgi:AbrB family looped-hinge helix DNA binding protein
MADQTAVRVGPQGRLVIPAELRRELGIEPGEILLARAEEGRLVLETRQALLRGLTRRFGTVLPSVDELLAERRREAQHEPEDTGDRPR